MTKRSMVRSLVEVVGGASLLAGTAALVWTLVPVKIASRAPAEEGGFRDISALVKGKEVATSKSPQRGNRSAPVVLVEYSDFECPSCGRFATTYQADLVKKYVETGKVLWIFKNLPLSTIHPLALTAAEAGLCAERQGKFWEMHDAIFRRQWELDLGGLSRRADEVGLDSNRFQACLGTMGNDVNRDRAEAGGLGIKGTPTFVIAIPAGDGRAKVVAGMAGSSAGAAIARVIDGLVAGR